MEFKEKIYHRVTHPQKRIWYIDKINTNSELHNIGGCLRIKGNIKIEELNKAINLVIKNNEGLRLQLIEEDGQPFQYVHEYEEQNIDFLDFSRLKVPQEEYEKWVEGVFKRRFTLEDSRLYYFAICKISKIEFVLLLNIHHIISDGWSISLIQKQVCDVYNRLICGESIELYQDFSYIDCIKKEEEYLESDKFLKNKAFWNDKFRDVTEDFLYKSSTSLKGNRKSFNIDRELSDKIKEFIQNNKCSLNTFFIAISFIYLNKTMNKDDITIGNPVFNRTGKKEKNTVGMFTSTMPFRIKLDVDSTIKDLISSINNELKACFYNQKYPYDLLIGDLELGKKGYDSLFKMSVNYYNTDYVNDMAGIEVEAQEYYSGSQSYSLQLVVKEWKKNNITLNYDFKINEYTSEDICIMHECMSNIINEILSDENKKITDISLLDKEDINFKVYKLNSTHFDYPRNKTIIELFEEQVEKTPDNIAVIFEDRKLTYKELNEKSNMLASYLVENGVKKEKIIGLMTKHSIELLIGIFGILKAGGAYLPIDPAYPHERINYMLEDSKSSMLLTDVELDKNINFDGKIVNLKNLELNSYDKVNLHNESSCDDLVYIIYTSGSTGKPKGVMIENRGLVNYIWWAKKTYLMDENEIVPLYSSISFDLTVTSIFTPLISGNQIIIYDNDENEFVLYKILRENKVTVVKLTPAHLTLIKDMDNNNSNIKRFIVGGEDLKVSLAKQVYESFGGKIEILNEYGPTETVVGCMIYKYDILKDKGVSVPIGYPADNVQVYLLDKRLNVVPNGIIGDLYVSGDGVARGYLNREELTKERFIDNPFIKGKKMYKTGDTARYMKDGIIEYIGRSDNQVKIRGHRIEILEIERHLLENQCIKDAVVTHKENDAGSRFLIAHVVTIKDITDSELKIWLEKFLPKYMIPSSFIFLKEIPLTVNGKVNYALLPDSIISEKEFAKYETDIEKELVMAMEEVLGIKNISLNDNYYQLGGDSIKAIQIASKLKNIGLEVKVKDILSCDNIKDITQFITVSSKNKIIDQGKCEGTIQNTPIMEWFFEQGFKNENYYNQYVLIELTNKIEADKIKIAVNKLIEHHDILRVNYNRRDNNLYYNNKYLEEAGAVKYIDLSMYTYYEQMKRINEEKSKLKIDFNLEKNILFRVYIFDLGENGQALLFSIHHIIVDGVSWRILLEDFASILEKINIDKEIVLPAKTSSFKDWSSMLREYSNVDLEEERAYWNTIIDKYTQFPVDFKDEQATVKNSFVLNKDVEEFNFEELIKKVNEIYNMEFNEVLITALVLAINKVTDNQDIIIELERHGRQDINGYNDISRTIGWFTSMYPAYLNVINGDLDYNIKSIKEQLRNIPSKGFNYGILKYLKKKLKKDGNQYIRFNYLGDFDNVINKNSLDASNIEFGLDSDEDNKLTSLMDIAVMIVNNKLRLNVTYSKNVFRSETIEKFIEGYISILGDILKHSSCKEEKEFTPSDFDAIDISQEDLDMLFN